MSMKIYENYDPTDQAYSHLDSSGSFAHLLFTSSSGLQTLTVPSSAQVANVSPAQSTAATSPVCPLNCTPPDCPSYSDVEYILPAFPISYKNALPASAPPLASH